MLGLLYLRSFFLGGLGLGNGVIAVLDGKTSLESVFLYGNSITDISSLPSNVNLPNLPQEKIEGIEITRLGEREYADKVEPGHDGKREYHWIRRGASNWRVVPGTDIWALRQTPSTYQ